MICLVERGNMDKLDKIRGISKMRKISKISRLRTLGEKPNPIDVLDDLDKKLVGFAEDENVRQVGYREDYVYYIYGREPEYRWASVYRPLSAGGALFSTIIARGVGSCLDSVRRAAREAIIKYDTEVLGRTD